MNMDGNTGAPKHAVDIPAHHKPISTSPPSSVRAKRVRKPSSLELLEELNAEVMRALSRTDALERINRYALLFGKAQVAVIAIYDSTGPLVHVAAASDPNLFPSPVFSSFAQLNDWVLKRLGENALETVPPSRARPPVTLQAPILFQGERIGLLTVYNYGTFPQDAKPALNVLAGLAAGVLTGTATLPDKAERNKPAPLEIALRHVGLIGLQALSPQIMAARLLGLLRSFVPFDNAAVYKRYGAAAHYVTLAISDGKRTYSPASKHQLVTAADLPLLHRVTSLRNPLYVPNVSQEPLWRPHLPGHTTGSWVGIRLASQGQVYGLLCVASHQTNFFTEPYYEFIELLRWLIAPVLFNAIHGERQEDENKRLSLLTRKVLTAQEDERKRVSRELHDEAGQSLTALFMNLELLQNDLIGQSHTATKRARESAAMAREALDRLNQLARQLRPPALDTLGLVGAIEQLCKDVERRSGLKVTLAKLELPKLPDSASITLYRFVQEALTNVTKHAHATHAEVKIELEQAEMCIRVHDDGKGFDQTTELKEPRKVGRLGLLGMSERLALLNGTLEIHSVPGDGTILVAHIPLGEQEETPVAAAN